MNNSLFALARQGLGFPQMDTFKPLARQPHPTKYQARRVRVLRPFHALRRVLEVGEIVTLPEPDAADAVALGRAEFVG